MSYDFDDDADFMHLKEGSLAFTREEDLEQVLDIAAIFLTDDPESTFSEEELLEQMREIAAGILEVSIGDVRETICRTSTLVSAGAGRWRLR